MQRAQGADSSYTACREATYIPVRYARSIIPITSPRTTLAAGAMVPSSELLA